MGNEQSAEAGKRFAGYQIYDQHYEKVGKVNDLFVDENDRPEYIGLKTGLFGGPSALIPMDVVRVNDARQLVEVASDKETIKNAPSFGDDAEITADFEDRVYAHFGATREASPTDRGGYVAYHENPDVDLAYGERSQPSGTGAAEAQTENREATDPPELDVANPPGSAGEKRGYTETKPDAEPQEGGRMYEWDIGAEPQETSSGGTGYVDEETRDPAREDAGAPQGLLEQLKNLGGGQYSGPQDVIGKLQGGG